jgi:4-hydroxy-3-polyprenylbenzoate decarboxylase
VARYTIAITGASGSAYGLRILEQLLSKGQDITLVMTDAGKDVLEYEIEIDLPAEDTAGTILRFLELPAAAQLRVACCSDLFDPIASGSHRMDGMIVAPASMGFCAAVATGLASNLAERAADVALKEKIPLVFVPRETPLSAIHLRNLTTLAEAGASIVPAMPAFYHRPATIDDQINFVSGKVLDVLGIEHDLFDRWGG